jgi:hypothetical protein
MEQELWTPLVDEAKEKLAVMGIYFDDVSFSIDPRDSWLKFEGVSIDLENKGLLSQLTQANEDWNKVVSVLSLLGLMGEIVHIGDYVWVEEVTWGREGPFVRVDASQAIDEPLEEFGYIDIDIHEMEDTLEDLLKDEADELLKQLKVELESADVEEEESGF